MKLVACCCVLAVAGCLLAPPAWSAEHAPKPLASLGADDLADRFDVQALIEGGQYEEAILILRPLLEQEPVDGNVLF